MQDSSPNPEYLKLLEEKRQYLKNLYPLEDRNNWLKEASNGGVIIHSIYEEKSGLKIIRAQTKIKAPREMVTAAAEEIDIIMQWDNTLESIKSHHKSEDYYIIQMVIKKLPLVVQRETLLVCKFFPEDNGVIFGVGTSIDHPSVEKVKNRIRASAYLVGWVLETDPVNPEYTIFTLILHVNPEGWIPKTVFNWFVYSQGYNIAQFGEYVEKKYKESK